MTTTTLTGKTHLHVGVTINKSPEQVYRFWRDFENLPRFMPHLESVQVLDNNRSHWVARGPADTRAEWDARIINDQENELIAWESVEGAQVPNAGSVRFVPYRGGRMTEVHLTMNYEAQGDTVRAAVASLFAPEEQVREDLCRLQQVMETGEVATIQGQPHGTCEG